MTEADKAWNTYLDQRLEKLTQDEKQTWKMRFNDECADAFYAGFQSREPDDATRAILQEMWESVLDYGDMMDREWVEKLTAFFEAWDWPREEGK